VPDCVIDASVGIKLFLLEDDSEAAQSLFSELAADPPSRFYVPDLFFVECGNILWKYVRHFSYPAENARQDVVDLCSLNLQTISTADLLSSAFELALQYDITAYDASYATLAQQLSLPLITADTALLRKLTNSNLKIQTLTTP
jgi:predicted nucleic acid-binding protein